MDRDALVAIGWRDPDGTSPTMPTDAQYEAHKRWAVETYGEETWLIYKGHNWYSPPF
jgi:hypothetical protein